VATPTIGGSGAHSEAPEPGDPRQLDDATELRRRADIALVAAIRATNYDLSHHRCKLLIPQLATYGAGTLINLWSNDGLFAACERMTGKLPAPPPTWPDEAAEFLEDVAWRAAPRFITHSLPKWTPEGGASVRSFYVTSCLFEFKRHYVPFARQEWNRHRHEQLTELAAPQLLNAPAPTDSPELQVVAQRSYDDILALADRQELRTIVELLQQGKTHQEIATSLGVSVNTVARRLAAYRRTLERNGWFTGRDGGR
jgi:DNA-directed RNA polymerase specialized sigma24 family protein